MALIKQEDILTEIEQMEVKIEEHSIERDCEMAERYQMSNINDKLIQFSNSTFVTHKKTHSGHKPF